MYIKAKTKLRSNVTNYMTTKIKYYTVCGNKKHPSTESSISSKLRNVFI